MENKKNLITGFLAIDLEKMRYKPLHSFFFFFKIGKWKSMPEIISVAVTQINMTHSTSMSYTGPATVVTNRHTTYCIFLRAKRANIRVYKGELEEMRRGANSIGKFLNVPVVDYCKGK